MKSKTLFALIIVLIVVACGVYFTHEYLKRISHQATIKTESIARPDFSFDILNRKIEIKDKASGKLIQEIALNQWIDATITVKDAVIFSDDINFDGYKDLAIISDTPADNGYGYSYYFYSPLTNKFLPEKNLAGLSSPTFDAKSKTISTYNSGGCAGADFEENIYSFADGKYVLTTIKEGACCGLDDRDAKLEVKVSELKNGKMEAARIDPCPTQ
jgi:hypothetical protein